MSTHCPKCGTTHVHQTRTYLNHPPRYKCEKCNATFVLNVWRRGHTYVTVAVPS